MVRLTPDGLMQARASGSLICALHDGRSTSTEKDMDDVLGKGAAWIFRTSIEVAQRGGGGSVATMAVEASDEGAQHAKVLLPSLDASAVFNHDSIRLVVTEGIGWGDHNLYTWWPEPSLKTPIGSEPTETMVARACVLHYLRCSGLDLTWEAFEAYALKPNDRHALVMHVHVDYDDAIGCHIVVYSYVWSPFGADEPASDYVAPGMRRVCVSVCDHAAVDELWVNLDGPAVVGPAAEG